MYVLITSRIIHLKIKYLDILSYTQTHTRTRIHIHIQFIHTFHSFFTAIIVLAIETIYLHRCTDQMIMLLFFSHTMHDSFFFLFL